MARSEFEWHLGPLFLQIRSGSLSFLFVCLFFLFVFKTGPCYIAQTDLKLGSFSFRLLDAGLEARTILTLPLLLMLFHLEHPKFL